MAFCRQEGRGSAFPLHWAGDAAHRETRIIPTDNERAFP
jgi:hypothetical protein